MPLRVSITLCRPIKIFLAHEISKISNIYNIKKEVMKIFYPMALIRQQFENLVKIYELCSLTSSRKTLKIVDFKSTISSLMELRFR
jgi:hypothetical protein